MTELDEPYAKIEELFLKYRKSAPIRKSKFAGAREEERYFDGAVRKELLILLATRGCRWYLDSGGCFMCSFNVGEPFIEYTDSEIISQVNEITKDYDLRNYDAVLIFPYSSLDTLEMPEKVREYIYSLLNKHENVKYVVFQSRPEFVTEKILLEIKEKLPTKKCYVYIGIESSDEFVRKYCVHKGLSFGEVKEKISLLKKFGMHVGAFLLFKPPFLTEKEAIDDTIKSIRDCFKIVVEDIHFMCNMIGEYSMTEILYKMKKYRSPWLWSVIEVLKNFNKEELKRITVSGFHIRANILDEPHNCNVCNDKVRKSIEVFNKIKDISVFDNLDCDCKKEWKKEVSKKYPPLRERIISDYKELIEKMEIL